MTKVDDAARRLGSRARRDVPLAPFTTYGVGGPAALFVEAAGVDDLVAIADAVAATDLAVVVVGRGSNLLVADAGFDGLAVALGDGFAGIEIESAGAAGAGGEGATVTSGGEGATVTSGGEGATVTSGGEGATVRAGAAVALPVLARKTAAAGLTGLEWAVGVPGSVGGAVRMNAGGHGSDVAESLESAEVFDLRDPARAARRVEASDLDLAYRHSAIGPGQVVVAATFDLRAGDRATAEDRIAEIVRWRREHQPGGANAGSVFTNPPGRSAGELIDEAGLKGLRMGSATVSPKHANFFQVDHGGRAGDVVRLMEEVRRRVLEHSGVELHPEVHQVGFESPSSGG